MTEPAGALSVSDGESLPQDRRVFLVFRKLNGEWVIRFRRAAGWTYSSRPPHYYFTNYLLAYGYWLRQRNEAKERRTA